MRRGRGAGRGPPRQGGGLHALLHGRGLARGQGRDAAFERGPGAWCAGVAGLGMEVCVTLGMLTDEQARRLKAAGLTAYNHNLDTSPEFYPQIITTRTYDERLDTLRARAGGRHQRLLRRHRRHGRDRRATAARCSPSSAASTRTPRACPSTCWCARRARPLEDAPDLDPLELVRMVASARLVCPQARVRLSAGRLGLSRRGPGPLLPGRRQLHLLRREAPHLAEPRRGRRRGARLPPRPALHPEPGVTVRG